MVMALFVNKGKLLVVYLWLFVYFCAVEVQ